MIGPRWHRSLEWPEPRLNVHGSDHGSMLLYSRLSGLTTGLASSRTSTPGDRLKLGGVNLPGFLGSTSIGREQCGHVRMFRS